MLSSDSYDVDNYNETAKNNSIAEELYLKQKNGLWKPDKCRSNRLFKQGYKLGAVISREERSIVRSAEKIVPGKGNVGFAIKTFRKNQFYSLLALTEVRCLKMLQHQLVVSLLETIETQKATYLILERASNGNLRDYVNSLGFLSFNESHRLFQQLLEAISFCHKQKICHRDIKLDNILLNDENNLRLCDFDLSAIDTRISVLSSPYGSHGYIAPEILTSPVYNGYKIDVWSAGICLYAMLCGRLPFPHIDKPDVYLEAVKNELIFTQPLSKELQSLIQLMLNVVPKYRPSIRSVRLWRWKSEVTQTEIHPSVSKISAMDPNAEHGFAMDQNTVSNFQSNLVSRFLKLAKMRDWVDKKQYQNEEFNNRSSNNAFSLKQLHHSFRLQMENELSQLGHSLSGEVLHHLIWTKGKLKRKNLVEGKTKKERLEQWRSWCNRIIPTK